MHARHLSRLVMILVGAAALYASGCGGFAIHYKPDPAAAAAANKGAVTLKVVDARDPDHGGTVHTHVGNARGGLGIPMRINDQNPDVAPRTIGEATTDALGRAGFSSKGGPKTLVATINNYWVDGFVGYACKIAVLYELQDASGKQLWTAAVNGGSGGTNITPRMFEKALSDLATRASEQFASQPFQQALAM
jgi:hypothetical protein